MSGLAELAHWGGNSVSSTRSHIFEAAALCCSPPWHEAGFIAFIFLSLFCFAALKSFGMPPLCSESPAPKVWKGTKCQFDPNAQSRLLNMLLLYASSAGKQCDQLKSRNLNQDLVMLLILVETVVIFTLFGKIYGSFWRQLSTPLVGIRLSLKICTH